MCSPLLKMLLGWLIAMLIIGYMISVQYKHHPKALFYLFFTEMWERFSYYGMRALLMLYMVKGLLLGDTVSAAIYGSYVALVYATPVIGGILSERYLGLRNAILLGASLMAAGHFGLAFETPIMFYISLALLALGNGFFKPNISSLVGQFYFDKDPRRDSAFTIFYMGVNTGAFLTPLTCGFLGEEYGWHWGFGAAGIGMLLGIIVFSVGNFKKIFEHKGEKPLGVSKSSNWWIYSSVFLAIPLIAWVFNNANSSKNSILFVALLAFAYLIYLTMNESGEEKKKMFSIVILFVFTILFWTFFELAGSVLTLYTDRNIDRVISNDFLKSIFCGEIKTSEFQSINPFFIILLAPLFSKIWEKWNISSGLKFALALFQLGFGFVVLVVGAKFADVNGFVPMVFMILGYFFFTTGELCLSPIGLSLVTKLSPAKLVSTIMGIWLLSATFAGIIGAKIGELTSLENIEVSLTSNASSLDIYTQAFEWIALVTAIAGVVLLFLVKFLKRWMQEN
ncbi:MAG: MFS transporter [Cytophagales bacterium]|nr:MAG: MFS transporter [Cytophagales bacterium]